MAISAYPAPLLKRNIVRLTSGTSWTVPSGVTNIAVTLIGGGGGGQGSSNVSSVLVQPGLGGAVVTSSLATTPGASIAYAIGAAGTGGTAPFGVGGAGGTTTFTGATSASGGNGGNNGTGASAQQGLVSPNGGACGSYTGSTFNGGAGGAGSIEIEYWSN